MWTMGCAEAIPGRIGCALRNALIPYRHGRGVTVWNGVHIDCPSRLRLGNDVSINRGTIIHAGGGVTIGDHVLIGPQVIIYSQNHRFADTQIPFDEQGYVRTPVSIGSNVWIAAGVKILPGVTIGSNTVVGAGAVVSRDVESGVLVAGNPAQVVRRIRS
jgi:maltose O-acetyltransferase